MAANELRQSICGLWRSIHRYGCPVGKVEGIKLNKYDVIGAVIAFLGMAIIMFAPRK